MTSSEDKPPSTADSLRRALAMKKAASGPATPGAANKPREKMFAARAAALNKPAFRKASKRG